MFLTQILLPLYDNDGYDISKEKFSLVRKQLIDRFGGLTTYTQMPANGFWQEDGEHTVRDHLIVYEIMSEDSDMNWWKQYRITLEKSFSQESIIIRQHKIDLL